MKEDFILLSNIKHDNKYNYTKINSKIKDKVCIICPIHGEFYQRKYDHKKGDGCPKCSKYKKLNIKDFIKRGNLIHNYNYDYKKSIIKKSKDKVCIICPTHGEFYQTPETHLNSKCGCPKCSNKYKLTTKEFIINSNIIHNNKYDYTETIYKRTNEKICIICPKHGRFYQLPTLHINKIRGCPKCSSNISKGEQKVINILNLNNINFIFQKRFKDCKNKHSLPFDFYLPDYNICIEYDGEQHTKPVSLFGGDEGFRNIQINDLIKDQYCDKNNISLIRIDFKGNIRNEKR